MRELDASDALRMPGHDKRVDEDFSLHLEPTVIKFEIIDGPPPDRENPEYPLARRIRLRAKELAAMGKAINPDLATLRTKSYTVEVVARR